MHDRKNTRDKFGGQIESGAQLFWRMIRWRISDLLDFAQVSPVRNFFELSEFMRAGFMNCRLAQSKILQKAIHLGSLLCS